MKISGALNEEEKEKIVEGNIEDEKNDRENKVGMHGEASQVSKLTLNGLLFYLGLPIDPLKKEEVYACIKKKTDKKEIKTNKKKKLGIFLFIYKMLKQCQN